jgi:hypothetical protein
MSTTAKMDSMPISTIIGMAKRNMALLILTSVKSCSEPLSASLNKRNSEAVFVKAAFMQKDKLKLRNKLAGADEKKRHLVRNQKIQRNTS